MSKRPRVGIIVYGSVLNPADLRDLFHTLSGRTRPVTVSGFERVFNQEASWRETGGQHRAVLNVKQNPDRWFNGVLITDVTRDEFSQYRERERGYRLVEVEQDEVEPYDPESIAAETIDTTDAEEIRSQELLLTTVGEKQNEDILPIHDYVEICLNGADSWGERFREDFLSTTRVTTGVTLSEYVDEEFRN